LKAVWANVKNLMIEYQYLIFEGKKPTAQDVWHKIRNHHADHDIDKIIQEVTADTIVWVSVYDNEQTFQRNSFDAVLTRLKKTPPI
jgi:hypothetical protein